MSDEDSPVGYRRPPTHSRFKKGQSGNPAGRPKGSKSMRTLMDAELNSKVRIRDGERVRLVTKAEALVKGLVNRGLKGDPHANRLLLGPSIVAGPVDPVEDPPQRLSADDEAIIEKYIPRKQEKTS